MNITKRQMRKMEKEIAKWGRPSYSVRYEELCSIPGLTARIRRLGHNGGNDLEGGIYSIQELMPSILPDIIREYHGGGDYEIRFHYGRRPLLYSDGRLETHRIQIEGPPKMKPPQKKSAMDVIKLINAVNENVDPSVLADLVRFVLSVMDRLSLVLEGLYTRLGPDRLSELFVRLRGIYQEDGWDINRMLSVIYASLAEAGLLPDDVIQYFGSPTDMDE